MFNVTHFPHGTFSWADLTSTDPAAARAFYAALMGWETHDVPMGPGQTYTFFLVDGRRAAAVGPMQPGMREQGMPSLWNNYVTVNDVDALVEQVTAAGGTVVAGPFDVFDDGRMMTIQDPSGAHVSLWQPKNSIGAGVVNKVGAMCWNELTTPDPQAAQDFYGKLLGWTFDDGDDTGYVVVRNQGRMNGGMLRQTPDMGPMPPAWSVYFNVADIHQTVAKAKALGGAAHTDVLFAASAGHFAVLGDPTGATFSVMQANTVDAWVEAEG